MICLVNAGHGRMAENISPLVLEEYLSKGDDRFLPALRESHDPKKLISIVERWKRDHRPWARKQIFDYLDLPMNVLGHEPVIKRLFKHAEERNDDELMAAFAVAFDRLVRRIRRKKFRYDYRMRTSWEEEHLFSPRNSLPHVDKSGRFAQNPKTLEKIFVEAPVPKNGLLFSYHTRYHLRRRAWRFFRRKGFQKPKEYCASVALMLRRYTDGQIA